MLLLFDVNKKLWRKTYPKSIVSTKAHVSIQLLHKIYTFFQIIAVFSGVSFIVTPFFTEGEQLPFTGYVPNHNFYPFVFVCFSFITVALVGIVVNVDVVLASLCYSFALHYKILCYEIESLADLPKRENMNRKCVKKLHDFSQRHEFLLL